MLTVCMSVLINMDSRADDDEQIPKGEEKRDVQRQDASRLRLRRKGKGATHNICLYSKHISKPLTDRWPPKTMNSSILSRSFDLVFDIAF